MEAGAAEAAQRPESFDSVARRVAEIAQVLRGIPDAVTIVDAGGRIVFANDPAAELMGYESGEAVVAAPPGETIGRFELLDQHGDPFPLEKLPGRLALRGVGAGEQVVRYRVRATGVERWSIVGAYPILDEAGKPVLAVNIFHDITEGKVSEERFRFLAEATEILSETIDHEETLSRIARLALPLLADWCIVDELLEGGALRRVAVAARNPEHEPLLQELRDRYPPSWDSPQPAGAALRAGKPVVFEFDRDSLRKTVRDERHWELIAALDPHAAVAAPLIAHGETVGAITFAFSKPGRAYHDDEVALAGEIARRAALAIDRSRLYRNEQVARHEAEAANERLRKLQDLSEVALRHVAVDEMVPELLSITRDILFVDSATILLADPMRNVLVAQFAKGLEEEVEKEATIPIGKGFAGRIASERRYRIVDDIENSEVINPILYESGIKSLLGVPLLIEDRVIGVLHVGSKVARSFDQEDVALLHVVADRVALALDRATVYEAERAARLEAEAAREQQRFLADASEILNASLEYETTLEQLARLSIPYLADCCVVDVFDETRTLRQVAVAHVDPEKEKLVRELERRYPTDEADPRSPVGSALRDRKTTFRPDLGSDAPGIARDPQHLAELESLNLVSAIIVPLVVRRETLGAITFLTTDSGRRYTPLEVALAEELGRRATLAVDNARLYGEVRRAFDASEEARALLDTLFETAPVGLGFFDLDLRYVRVNEALAEINGLSVDDHVGRHASEVIESMDVEREFRRIVETGRPIVDFEVSGETATRPGEIRHWLSSYYPVHSGEGEVVGLGVVVTDITERQRADAERARLLGLEQEARAAAERAQERLSFLAEASSVLASSLDYEATLQRVAELAVPGLADWAVVDIANEDLSTRRVALSHADPAKVAQALEVESRYPPDPNADTGVPKVLRTAEPELMHEIPDELLVQAAHDEEHLALIRELGLVSYMCVPLVARRRVLGALTFVSSSRARLYTEADLALAQDLAHRAAVAVDNARLFREAEERGEAARVLEYVDDGVFLLDRHGVIRLWNPAAETITGLRADEVIERAAPEVISGWDDVVERVPVSPGAAPGAGRAETLPLEFRGREVWISISGVAFPEGTVYAFRDLTEERRLDELKTEFVATASHELRTPLAAVYGAAMTLKRHGSTLDDARSARLLDVIADESDRLARTVNDILWASRVDSGRVDVTLDRVDPVDAVTRAVRALEPHLPGGIRIEIAAEGDVPPVAADDDKLRQILANLIENAAKYSPDGGAVEVRVERQERHVRFAVRDEGLGIPPHEQRRIFEKFYRLDPNLTRGVGGTGLGLYICRELVQRMGGRIWVASREYEGSTFFFELPVAELA